MDNGSMDIISNSPAITNGYYGKKDVEPLETIEVVRGLTDIQTWLTGVAYLGLLVSLYSYSLFLPTIVSGLGYSGGAAQLHTVPPYAPAVVLTGYILAITAETNGIRYLAVFFMAAGM
ncbi:hypothetical protein C0993_009573 [Termitomyces sp. T159_Od127]|nr:hypothetical protein C0993_009573 [Termitomyces sp. T159_Od127]